MNETAPTIEHLVSYKLTVITIGSGTDADHTLLINQAIAGMQANERVAFVVNGGNPLMGAAMIAELYQAKTKELGLNNGEGECPFLALGEPSKARIADNRIFSQVTGNPISESALCTLDSKDERPIDRIVLSEDEFQSRIDRDIRKGKIESFNHIVGAPLFGDKEAYNPSLRPELAPDAVFQANWQHARPTYMTQFERKEDGTFQGNNYDNSPSDVRDRYTGFVTSGGGITAVYIDGAVAKYPGFNATLEQPLHLAAAATAMKTYIQDRQSPWANLTEAKGGMPTEGNMHVGMFCGSTEWPFLQHTTGKVEAGFGVERLLKEVCRIDKDKQPEQYATVMQQVKGELDSFDGQILDTLQATHPEMTDVPTMRQELHDAMYTALQEFGKRKGILGQNEQGQHETVSGFKELFALARDRNIPLEARTFMREYKAVLFEMSPLAEAMTQLADAEKKQSSRTTGKTHEESIADILIENGAGTIIYNPVTAAAAKVVLRNDQLREHFTEEDGVVNITQRSVDTLKEKDPDLHRAFQLGIVSEVTRNGLNTVATPEIAAAKALDNPDERRLDLGALPHERILL